MSEQTEGPSYQTCGAVNPSCPLEATIYAYRPNLGAAAFFLAAFSICFFISLVFAFRMKTHGFSTWLLIGIALEMVGYAARVALNDNPWSYGAMVAHMTGTFLAPSFINAAISVTFKHISYYCGEEHLKLRAKWFPIVFIGTDFTAIFIQLAGAGLSAASSSGGGNQDLGNIASGVMLAGVSFQVANMVLCGGLIVLYAWNYKKPKSKVRVAEKAPSAYDEDKTVDPKAGSRFRIFVGGLITAYMAILIRCCYRIPEMSQGWRGELMQTENTFLVLDSTMLTIACFALTIAHPAIFFNFMANKGHQQRQ